MSDHLHGFTASRVAAMPSQAAAHEDQRPAEGLPVYAPRSAAVHAPRPAGAHSSRSAPAHLPRPAPPHAPRPVAAQQDALASAPLAVAAARAPAPRLSAPRASAPAGPGVLTARTATPRPSAPRPPVARPAVARPVGAVPDLPASPGTRASVRDDLLDALDGVPFSGRDRQFLGRLVHWDKRNAASVVSLLKRARQAGRAEIGLSPVQLQTVLAALQDAVVHRVSGVGSVGCWDCENARGGRCPDHAGDFERARDYAGLAALLSAERAPTPIQPPTDISGYRRRTPIVS